MQLPVAKQLRALMAMNVAVAVVIVAVAVAVNVNGVSVLKVLTTLLLRQQRLLAVHLPDHQLEWPEHLPACRFRIL
jgi:hypothetical protein